MEGDGIRDRASGSSLESSKNSTHLLRTSKGASQLSGADIGSALGELMKSVSLESGPEKALASDLESTGGSTPSTGVEKDPLMDLTIKSTRPQNSSKAGSSVVSGGSFVVPSSSTRGGSSAKSTLKASSKSGSGDSFLSEGPVYPLLSPGYIDDRFTSVELRKTDTPGRGEIVGDLSGEGGLVYTTDR